MVKVIRIKHALLCAFVATASLTAQATQQNKSLYGNVKSYVSAALSKLNPYTKKTIDLLSALDYQNLSDAQLNDIVKKIIDTGNTKKIFICYTLKDILQQKYGLKFLEKLFWQCHYRNPSSYSILKEWLLQLEGSEYNVLIKALQDQQENNPTKYNSFTVARVLNENITLIDVMLQKLSSEMAATLIHLIYAEHYSFLHCLSVSNDLSPSSQKIVTKQLKACIKEEFPEFSELLDENTPTALHIQRDFITMRSFIERTSTLPIEKKNLEQFFKHVVQEEKKLIANGYYVFFHSQRWPYLLIEKLYTDLWALTQRKKRPKNYLFPHVRIKKFDPLAEGQLDRKSILETGRTNSHNRQALLFTNNSFLGNYLTNYGSSSLYFFLSNSNVHSLLTITPQDVFDHYNLDNLYNTYKQEIQDIESLFYDAQTLGTVLMIAIPKNMVNNYCYAALPYGYKQHAITNTRDFLDGLSQSPPTRDNNEEFCVIMLDKAMDPEGGILIKPYHCADKTIYQQFEQAYEKLIQKISADLASNN